jgi:hypothetical protein
MHTNGTSARCWRICIRNAAFVAHRVDSDDCRASVACFSFQKVYQSRPVDVRTVDAHGRSQTFNRASTRRTCTGCHCPGRSRSEPSAPLNQGVVAIRCAAITCEFGASHRWMERQSPSEPSSLVPGGALVAFWSGPFTLRAARTPADLHTAPFPAPGRCRDAASV